MVLLGAPENVYIFCRPLTLFSFIFEAIWASKMIIWGNLDEWFWKIPRKKNVDRFAADSPEIKLKKVRTSKIP